jgi:CSLREA domain-containing protein
MRRILLSGALATLMAVVLAGPARAATLTVNSTADTDDGACTTASGGCTLREAIDAANPGRGALRTRSTSP